MKRKRNIVIICLLIYSLILGASNPQGNIPAPTPAASIQQLEPISRSAVDVAFIDKTPPDHWGWKLLSIISTVIVPLGALLFTWWTNRDNNQRQLSSLELEYKNKLKEKVYDEKIKRIGEVIANITLLDKELLDSNTITIKKLQDAVYKNVEAYPYLGDEFYSISKDILNRMGNYGNAKSKSYSIDAPYIQGKIGEYMKAYKELIDNEVK